ncbi:hypothetical protein ACFX1R_006725 [Malus domestica]
MATPNQNYGHRRKKGTKNLEAQESYELMIDTALESELQKQCLLLESGREAMIHRGPWCLIPRPSGGTSVTVGLTITSGCIHGIDGSVGWEGMG